MRLNIFSTALTLFTSATLALPAPDPAPPQLQSSIQNLTTTISTIQNDIAQSNANLMSDFESGRLQFATLIEEVAGPQSCSPFVPGRPGTAEDVLAFLQKSQAGLQELSLHLMDPSKSIAASDFHADVCVAWGYYWGCAAWVGY